MFTGIIEELGQVKNICKRGNITVFEVLADKILEDTRIGDSISVNGVCLSVIKKDTGILSFEVMPETRQTTGLKDLRISDRVNLERSLKIGDRVCGHFLTGHVDCIGVIRYKKYIKGNLAFLIAVPAAFIKYCLPKGSIALDGISLTIAEVKSAAITVYIIPHTLKNTTLGKKGPSDKVNVEFDILAKKE